MVLKDVAVSGIGPEPAAFNRTPVVLKDQEPATDDRKAGTFNRTPVVLKEADLHAAVGLFQPSIVPLWC
mgnify:FL=1